MAAPVSVVVVIVVVVVVVVVVIVVVSVYIYIIYIYIIYELFEDGYESSVILIRCSMLTCDDEPTPN